MQLTAFGDLNLGAKQFFNGMGKWLTDIPAIRQDALNSLQIGSAAAEGNVIAKQSGRGLWMTAVGTEGNAIRRNSIYENQGTEVENKLGIDGQGS